MSVRVNETGGDNLAPTIEHFRIRSRLDVRMDICDLVAFNQEVGSQRGNRVVRIVNEKCTPTQKNGWRHRRELNASRTEKGKRNSGSGFAGVIDEGHLLSAGLLKLHG